MYATKAERARERDRERMCVTNECNHPPAAGYKTGKAMQGKQTKQNETGVIRPGQGYITKGRGGSALSERGREGEE